MSMFILRPVLTTLLSLSIIIGGYFSFLNLPVNDLPSIEKPNIQITTNFTGANPSIILNQITIPLEKELVHVDGIKEMSSESTYGSSEILLAFDPKTNMNEALFAVQAAVKKAEINFSKEVDRPTFSLAEGGRDSILYLLFTSNEKKELENYAENLIIPKLNQIKGVAKAKTLGFSSSISLKLDPELMAARKIGFNQVIETLQTHLSDKPLGSIHSSNKRLFIELERTNEKELKELPIIGSSLKIKDIGELVSDPKHDKEVFFVKSGEKQASLLFGIQKMKGANTVLVAELVDQAVQTLQKELPPTFNLHLWFNKASWVKDSIHEVEWTMLLSFFFTLFVLYIAFKNWQTALIPGVSIPLSLLGSFIALYFFGFSLDFLSLLALTIAIGFVVDDAIVVVENIARHEENGDSPLQASLKGTKEITFTIISMTFSLAAVFIPLLFLGGMFWEFNMTLVIAILISAVISLTLVPLLCSRFLKKETLHKTEPRIYAKFLKTSLKYPGIVLFSAAGSCILSVFLFAKLPVVLIPEEDRGALYGVVQFTNGLNPEDQLNTIISQNNAVDSFIHIRMDDSLLFLIRLKKEQKGVALAIEQKINQIPGILATFQPYQMIHLDFDFGTIGKYRYVVQGPDFEKVDAEAEKIAEKLKMLPEFTGVKVSQNQSPKLNIVLDGEKAAHYKLTKQHVQELLGYAYSGNPIGHILEGKKKTPLYIDSDNLSLSKLHLTTREGIFLPLKLIADWKENIGTSSLAHKDQIPSKTIRFSLKAGTDAIEELKKMEKIADLKPPLKGKFVGSAEKLQSSKNEWLFIFLTSALAMYVVLGVLYESFIHPLTILSSIPFAGIGGALTLFAFDEPLSLFSGVGFLLLIGIVKKNGIMIVDYALAMQKKGVLPKQAIYEGCLVRYRPIMMTTAAAIMGALPLAFSFGPGSEMRRGLGLVIVGGLVFSQILTLFATPALFLFFDFLKSKIHAGFVKKTHPNVEAPLN